MIKKMKSIQHLFTFILMFLFFTTSISAQCPNQDDENKLDGQAEVDAFLAENPNCTYLWELELSGDVTDISGFSTLTSVSYLYIDDCPNLTDISAFSNIDSIFGNLGFYDTEGLTSPCGLHNLVYIGNDLRFEGTVSIETLEGLENVNFIGDDISIEENENLENLNGIQNSFLIPGSSIRIRDNPSLTNCCGIQHLVNNTEDLSLIIENTPSFCSSEQEIIDADCNFPISSCITNTEDVASIDIKIYPNPAHTILKIANREAVEIDEIVMFNSFGHMVLRVVRPSTSIDIDFLSGGLYIAEIRIGDLKMVEKLVVQE